MLNAEYMSMLYNTLEMWDFISYTVVRALFPGNIFFSRSVLIPTFVTIQLSLFQKLSYLMIILRSVLILWLPDTSFNLSCYCKEEF